MPLKKTITVEQFGTPVSLHRIDIVTVNYVGKNTAAQISSFYDEAAMAEERVPLATTSMNLDGVPGNGQDPRAFVETELVQAAPANEEVDETLRQYGTNRYAFQGAKIVG
ncbi:hypothetical protein [Burkholderia sp. IMCC1007]|uniref:hypothetical protein n=1 Tax=Burkholderia sp. IMCC1007 TaxID=3004104 RepID=UPI0022B56A0E|nr:hypothetical protein [Burkholderia sp. IMCC1007]